MQDSALSEARDAMSESRSKRAPDAPIEQAVREVEAAAARAPAPVPAPVRRGDFAVFDTMAQGSESWAAMMTEAIDLNTRLYREGVDAMLRLTRLR